MPDITALVPAKTSVPSPQQPPARGVIITAPAALSDATVAVVVPRHSTTYSLELRWIRQGAALPAAGADCKVVFDETGEGIVVWWAGGDAQTLTAAGTATLTWTASTSSASQVIAHGLPTTPANVQVTPRSLPFAGGVVIAAKCTARDGTNITINGEATASVSGSVVVDWLARS